MLEAWTLKPEVLLIVVDKNKNPGQNNYPGPDRSGNPKLFCEDCNGLLRQLGFQTRVQEIAPEKNICLIT